MCMECLQAVCPVRCPNYTPPKAVYHCEICKEGIVDGEEYIDIDGEKYHYDCFADLGVREMVDIVGGTVREASLDDLDDRC